MAYRVLDAHDAEWRPSNQMGVMNADLAKPLGAETLGARLWRVEPGQASTRHRHIDSARQFFNDTDAEQLWLIVGAPLERFTPQDLTPEQLASIYPDGPKALPAELGGT